jgi:hypothetical protein
LIAEFSNSLAPATVTSLKDRSEITFDADEVPSFIGDDEEEEEDIGPNHLYYSSEKINGKLFRAIDEEKIWFEAIKSTAKPKGGVWSGLLKYVLSTYERKLGAITWEHSKEAALRIREAYVPPLVMLYDLLRTYHQL